jgi:hypothetical protein
MVLTAVSSQLSPLDLAVINKDLASYYFRFSLILIKRFGILILLLLVSLLTSVRAYGGADVRSVTSLNLWGFLPPATVNEPYNAALPVGGGRSPYHFSLKAGTLPPGIVLNEDTGVLSGTPAIAGNFSFEVIVIDSLNLNLGYKMFVLEVERGVGNGGGVTVEASPSSVALFANQQQQFTASVSGTSNTAVTWSATAGTISASGLYTAPSVSAQTSVTVTAISRANPTKSASVSVTVNTATPALQITTSNLAPAQQGETYNATLAATGGTAPYSWTVSGGTIPSGIALNVNGDLAGVPVSTGTFNFTVTATDSTLKTASATFTATVIAGSNFDGPAELPRVTVASAMADTPAPGTIINVNSGGSLQGALNQASCGDTIELQAGATFSGLIKVPAKNCDNSHWIIIRTSSPDSVLPAEGQRATPCYAGVASLTGRPQYICANPKNVMAKVQMPNTNDGPFLLLPGANFYRFLGLEITRPAGVSGSARLITAQGTADHIVVDRSWLHGALQDETRSGIVLNGMTNVAIVDSYFSDFHCISGTGTCTDAHAISGGNSDTQDGPYKIQDNFLEASSEAILFGGGAATFSPSDIQIIGNHFWKPWQWMPGSPDFVGAANGHAFVVKNHLELKNAVRVLVEGNLMENNWGGFSQNGYGILLTPRNQPTKGGKGPYICPLCQVTDITIRYSHISHAGGGIVMATIEDIPAGGKGAPALAGTRWSIHDIVLDDLNKKYDGGGTAFELNNAWSKNPLNTVTINHVTAFPDTAGHMMIVGNPKGAALMYGLVFTNNLIVTGLHPVWGANGGVGDCASSGVPITIIVNCFTTSNFSNNALITPPAAYPPARWPIHNMFAATIEDVSFATFNDANNGDYELQPNSPYKNKGTDGKDLGADIAALNAALANVQ